MSDKAKEESKELNLEEGLKELENILDMLDNDTLSLEESFRLYKKGVELVRECSDSIDRIEKQLAILSGEEDEV